MCAKLQRVCLERNILTLHFTYFLTTALRLLHNDALFWQKVIYFYVSNLSNLLLPILSTVVLFFVLQRLN